MKKSNNNWLYGASLATLCSGHAFSVVHMFVDDLDREESCLNGESRRPFTVGSINIWTEKTFLLQDKFVQMQKKENRYCLKSWIPSKMFEKYIVVILCAHGSGQHFVVSLRDVPI